jgi:hypothetical protein
MAKAHFVNMSANEFGRIYFPLWGEWEFSRFKKIRNDILGIY